jgi:hypothetical protein
MTGKKNRKKKEKNITHTHTRQIADVHVVLLITKIAYL